MTPGVQGPCRQGGMDADRSPDPPEWIPAVATRFMCVSSAIVRCNSAVLSITFISSSSRALTA
jgi:hypothetical protein